MSPFQAVVDRVIDGDTLWIRVRLRTRSSAPETGEAGGPEATAALKKQYRKGQKITVSPIITDEFGRIIGTIDAKT